MTDAERIDKARQRLGVILHALNIAEAAILSRDKELRDAGFITAMITATEIVTMLGEGGA